MGILTQAGDVPDTAAAVHLERMVGTLGGGTAKSVSGTFVYIAGQEYL